MISFSHRITFAVCASLLCLFGILSWTAVLTKNATIDEPLHLMSGWVAIKHDDFRLVPESPCLWQMWAALPNAGTPLKTTFEGKEFSDLSFDPQAGINWAAHTLYETPGNDGEAVILRSRFMMLLIGITLGAFIAFWSYQLAGKSAAILACAFYCLDPNFLAHAPIIKSDVAFSLVTFALAMTAWQLGRRATVARLIAIGVFCGAGMNIKFSGPLLLFVLGGLLLIRSISPHPWPVFGRAIRSRIGRIAFAGGVCLSALFFCWAITWAAYGFRFRPAPSVNSQMDMAAIRHRTIELEAAAGSGHDPSAGEIANWKPSLIVQAVDFANQHRLLPQAMLGGLLYQHACLQLWPGYLLGQLYGTGRWYYFPIAIACKTPIVTLAAVGFSLVLLLIGREKKSRQYLWAIACVTVPFAIFAIAAMQSNLNIGLRSVLPLYPFLFVMIGTMLAGAIKRWRRGGLVLTGILVVLLLGETLSTWPDYIPFFNQAVGGKRGGFAVLGDSNLDWGQDLKPLAEWQRQHPEARLYYGAVDPAYFGFQHQFQLARDGSHLESDVPMQAGYLAVSTNFLQGLHDEKYDVDFFRRLGSRPPDEIVGGSIYLYRYPLR
jgi:hypothetical protein